MPLRGTDAPPLDNEEGELNAIRHMLEQLQKTAHMASVVEALRQGTADEAVDPVMTEEYYRSIRRSGSYAELRLLEGVRHEVVPVMQKELLLWFNRFC